MWEVIVQKEVVEINALWQINDSLEDVTFEKYRNTQRFCWRKVFAKNFSSLFNFFFPLISWLQDICWHLTGMTRAPCTATVTTLLVSICKFYLSSFTSSQLEWRQSYVFSLWDKEVLKYFTSTLLKINWRVEIGIHTLLFVHKQHSYEEADSSMGEELGRIVFLLQCPFVLQPGSSSD